MKKICGISTKAVTISAFMIGNLQYMAQKGYKSYCISNPSEIMTKDLLGDVEFVPIEMKWGNVSPIEVIRQVYAFYVLFKKEKFDVIQFATANAGLYASIAGWLAGVPVRIFLQWGIAYPDHKGVKRIFYKSMEKATCMFASSVQPDSRGILNFAIDEGLYNRKKGDVLYNGSACGINLDKFDITNRYTWRKTIRKKYSLSDYKIVYGFIGRVVPEKGINELLQAFIDFNRTNTCLLIVGSCEEVSRLDQNVYRKSLSFPNIVYVGQQSNPQEYFSAMDFMVLPSYREGFGMVVLEAGAMGTPSIISNINGPTEFVKDGYNGLICDVKSVSSLHNSIEAAYNQTQEQYYQMSKNSYEVAKNKFDSNIFKQLFFENREKLLSEATK